MERYDTPPSADLFAASTNFFESLVTELRDPATGRLAHHELEELLDTRGRLLMRQLLQDHLDLRALREEQAVRTRRPVVTGREGLVRPRLERGHQRQLATLFGTVTVRRCAWRRPGAVNIYPADAALSLPARRHSYSLARLAVLESVRASFDAATAAITRRCGPVVGKRQAEARDPDHRRRWVVLVDGARHQLDLIQAEAARRDVAVETVVDFVHVLEYLWGATWCFHASGDPAAEDWVAAHALSVLAGGALHVAQTIRKQAAAAALTSSQQHGVDACIRYLTGKEPFLRYERALAAGWPIATGVIEGACRHLVGDRLDITGARWGLAGAEAVLKLRALISNGDLDAYWRYHLARAHHRIYLPHDQEGYALAV
ncbi:hypothetical protein LKL35_32325 [Streptomyces sp. ET3-23]|uniref:hypothetical protein n=1 Tax=Streptomyces sp. ET3-23 TaxID=2885643 RepID=UPI001D129F16|nr:hypothetical protein [Streptomyces sp. ET3-23]MCC2280077.1 hypothetical protein [Streptomyces sp. ET3-23]